MKQSMIAMAVASGLMAAATGGEQSTSTGGAAKAPRFCEKDWDDAYEGKGDIIYFRFSNGTTLELDMKEVPDETVRLLAFHGASQKVGDSFAGVKGNFSEGITNAQQVIDLLKQGEWSAEREGGGPRLAELAEAISRIKGVPIEKVKAAVEAATPEERSNWRSNAGVKAEVAKLRAEKAQAALDAQGEKKEEITINLG